MVDIAEGIVIASLTAVLGYALNSWRDRSFEKRRTNYRTKLEAFTRMTNALSRIGENILMLKMYYGTPWSIEPEDQLVLSTNRMLMNLSLARTEDRLLGAETAKHKLDTHARIMEKQDEEQENAALKQWLLDSLIALTVLRLRTIDYYERDFAAAFYATDIIIDSDVVEERAVRVHEFILADLSRWAAHVDELSAEAVAMGLAKFEELHQKLRDAMRNDLDETL